MQLRGSSYPLVHLKYLSMVLLIVDLHKQSSLTKQFCLDVPLWSKLETGRIPQPPELFQMIDNHLNMAGPQLSFDS